MFTRNYARRGCTPMIDFVGRGYIAGEPPASSALGEPDGRFKILNVPSRGRIGVYERGSMLCVRSTCSGADGTWRVENLSTAYTYVVIGFDDRHIENAAIQDWIMPAVEAP